MGIVSNINVIDKSSGSWCKDLKSRNDMTSFIKSAIVIPKAFYFEIQTGLERSAVRDIREIEVMKPLPFGLARPWSRKFVGDVYQ